MEEEPQQDDRRGLTGLVLGAVDRGARTVLDSRIANRIWQRTLESDEAQKLVERVAEAPEVRAAITRQGVGLVDDLRRELAKAARRLDATVERPFRWLFRRGPRGETIPYAGVMTRGLALAIDAAIINFALLGLAALFGLVASLFGDPPDGAPAIVAGSLAWLIAGSLYLTSFWTLTGQTPGMRFMAITVERSDGSRLTFGRSVRRLIGGVLSVLTLGLGFAAAMINARRRGLHDKLADSVVAYVAPPARPGRR